MSPETPSQDEVITSVLAHHARQTRTAEQMPSPPADGYNQQALDILFGSQLR